MKIRNKNITKSDKIKSTKEGKLYIDSKDFWNDKIIIILLSCMSLFANELFLYDANEKTELSEVIDNKLN